MSRADVPQVTSPVFGAPESNKTGSPRSALDMAATMLQHMGQVIHTTITVSCNYLSLSFGDTYLWQDTPHM